jgi:hypothetical protein
LRGGGIKHKSRVKDKGKIGALVCQNQIFVVFCYNRPQMMDINYLSGGKLVGSFIKFNI